jgi:mono/diheme cytochrome c family protein
MLVAVVVLTMIAVVEAPPRADASDLTFAAAGIDGHGLFITSCAHCHGDVGEGAPNPAQPGDIIPPISTAEYLASRTDESIRTVVAAGLPGAGMAAFEVTHGGPLHAEEVDAIVAHIRSWESDPPVQLDGSVSAAALSNNAEFLYPELCAGCHGIAGEGGSGSALADPGYQQSHDDLQIFNSINLGHEATAMVAWGSVLSHGQITDLVNHIRTLGGVETVGAPRYTVDVLPIFEVRCVACHGSAGGWDATTWTGAVESGNNAPVLVPGDPDGSIIVQMMSGTHPDGILMPPDGKLPDALVQLVVDWIEGGALE